MLRSTVDPAQGVRGILPGAMGESMALQGTQISITINYFLFMIQLDMAIKITIYKGVYKSDRGNETSFSTV